MNANYRHRSGCDLRHDTRDTFVDTRETKVHLDWPDLSASFVAAHHRLPLRYLQRLFESEELSCTAFILERRLVRAHRMLSDPALAHRPVTLIAFDVGFHHLSRFYTTFRARFGASPVDIRAQALAAARDTGW